MDVIIIVQRKNSFVYSFLQVETYLKDAWHIGIPHVLALIHY